MTAKEFYDRHATVVWIAAVALPLAVLGVGLVVDPYTFWDRFLWEDIWGPTVTDANGWAGACWSPDAGPVQARRVADPTAQGQFRLTCPDGQVLALDGYTPTSEATFGIVLAAILYGVYAGLIRGGRIETDGWFILGLLPYAVFGPVVRALEDARVFMTAEGDVGGLFSYIFISPWLYIQIGVYAILALLLGVFLRNTRARTTPVERLLIVSSVLVLISAAQSFALSAFEDEFYVRGDAAWPWAAAVAGAILFWLADARGARLTALTAFVLGLPIVAPAVGLMTRWVADPWVPDPGYHFRVALFVLVFATGVTLAVWLFARVLRSAWPDAGAYMAGINLAIVFGHMLDGFATFLTLCSRPTDTVCTGAAFLDLGLGGFGEKHPLSAFLLGVGNGWGFPIAKLAMVLLVIGLLERERREGSDADRALVGLIQLAIFSLGFGPGLRDLLLVALNLGAA